MTESTRPERPGPDGSDPDASRGWRRHVARVGDAPGVADVWLALALAGACLVAAWSGSAGPGVVELKLGPGDEPYVRGFEPEYEVRGRDGRHWSQAEAGIVLPIVVEGSDGVLVMRVGRPLDQTARVETFVDGRSADTFQALRRAQERRIAWRPGHAAPLRVHVSVASPDGNRLGLLFDWLRLEYGAGTRVRLSGIAAAQPALAVALLFLAMRLAGWKRAPAAWLTVPWACAACFGLLGEPWLVHRLLRGVPWAMAALGAAGIGLGRALVARRRAGLDSVAALALLVATAFLLRALAMNHPDFYHPDLASHARLAEILRAAGLDFWRHPSRYVWEHGVWRKTLYGESVAMPYSPLFHVPFALSALSYDQIIVAMKLAAAALSTVPIVVAWALARRLQVSARGALLLVVVPTYALRLALVFVAAVFGHAADMAFLYWLSGRVRRLASPRVLWQGAAFVAACQLAYVSSVLLLPVFLGALALVLAVQRRPAREWLAPLALGAAGCGVAFALYYRDFSIVGLVASHELGGAGPPGAHRLVRGVLDVAWERTSVFFGWIGIPALIGLPLLVRRRDPFLWAWALSLAVLLAGRARLPDVFAHAHETPFATPLVCLVAGDALRRLEDRGVRWRALAAVVWVLLAAHGLWTQWQVFSGELHSVP